jgi:hypothetical protein
LNWQAGTVVALRKETDRATSIVLRMPDWPATGPGSTSTCG